MTRERVGFANYRPRRAVKIPGFSVAVVAKERVHCNAVPCYKVQTEFYKRMVRDLASHRTAGASGGVRGRHKSIWKASFRLRRQYIVEPFSHSRPSPPPPFRAPTNDVAHSSSIVSARRGFVPRPCDVDVAHSSSIVSARRGFVPRPCDICGGVSRRCSCRRA